MFPKNVIIGNLKPISTLQWENIGQTVVHEKNVTTFEGQHKMIPNKYLSRKIEEKTQKTCKFGIW